MLTKTPKPKIKPQDGDESRKPPHALLPEDEYEEVPVHNSGDK